MIVWARDSARDSSRHHYRNLTPGHFTNSDWMLDVSPAPGQSRPRCPSENLRVNPSDLSFIQHSVRMRLHQLFVFAFFIFAGCSQGRIPHVRVILGDPFTLPENCQTNEEGDLYRLDLYGTPGLKVAAHKQGVWTPTEVYRERIGKNSSVVFNPAVYTDTGVYELRCGARGVDVQVKVVMSSKRCISEGEAVSLPCYFSTRGKARWSVRWEKNREDVLKRNSWEDTGAAEGRLSLSEDWVSHGNFSLTLKQAQKDDQGDYFCYIQDEVVIAVRLTVISQRNPDQSSTRPPFLPPTPTACDESRILPAVIITAVVCLPVGLLIGLLMTSCCSSGASYGHCGRPNEA